MYWFYFKGLKREDAKKVFSNELFQNFSNENWFINDKAKIEMIAPHLKACFYYWTVFVNTKLFLYIQILYSMKKLILFMTIC